MNMKVRDVALWSLGAVACVFACMTPGNPASTQSAEAPLPQAPGAKAAATPAKIETPPPVASMKPASPPPPPASTEPAPLARSAAVQPSATPAASRGKTPPKTQNDCKACNGDWGIHGLSPTPSCNCRTTDGGKLPGRLWLKLHAPRENRTSTF
jgi:hypothetical protein